MIELATYVLGPAFFYGLLALLIVQLAWQVYRMLTAHPTLLRFNAFALIAVTLLALQALWPPFDYQSLGRHMIFTLLIFPFAIIAIFTETRFYKMLAIGHVGFACAFFYVLVQAAR